MRVLHIDYGILEYSELVGVINEITTLINSCDIFTHFELTNFTQNDKHGIKIRMELMENNRPQDNNLPAEPAKSMITFSVFRNSEYRLDGLRQLSYLIYSLHDLKPFHDEVIPPYENP